MLNLSMKKPDRDSRDSRDSRESVDSGMFRIKREDQLLSKQMEHTCARGSRWFWLLQSVRGGSPPRTANVDERWFA